MLFDKSQIQLAFKLACECAWEYQLCTIPNPAVGAALLGERGEIITVAAHQKAGMPHAEVLALQQGYAILSGNKDILNLTDSHEIHEYLSKQHNGVFTSCSLVVTLEPCNHQGRTPPCAQLIETLRLRHVFFAMHDTTDAQGGCKRLHDAHIPCEHVPTSHATSLLHPFLCLQKGRFVCFKYAQRLDGSIDLGLISSIYARTLTHHWRSGFDLLVISGQTVRNDKPVLDTRLVCSSRSPDVAIFTRRHTSIDKNIPLFNIERKVHFVDSLESLFALCEACHYKSILVEGGRGLFASMESCVDMIAVFVSPHLHTQGQIRIHAQQQWNLWHMQSIVDDLHNPTDSLLWLGR